MKALKIFLSVVLFFSVHVNAQEYELSNPQSASFEVTSFKTTSVNSWEMTAAGEAGRYGRVYLNFNFTNKLNQTDQGEYTGYGWAQNGESFDAATLQGSWRRQGDKFKLFGMDAVLASGAINFVTCLIDMVAGNVNCNFSEIE
jgi:hypothetical protein